MLKEDVRIHASLTKSYTKEMQKIEEEYKKAKESTEYWESKLEKSIDALNEFKRTQIYARRK